MDLVDRKKIIFKVAEKLSYLTDEEQKILFEGILESGIYPNFDMAESMKSLSENGILTEKKLKRFCSVKNKF